MHGGSAACPFCGYSLKPKDLRKHGVDNEGFSEQIFAICELRNGKKFYRDVTSQDHAAWHAAIAFHDTLDSDAVPTEPITNIKGRFNIYVYGYREWGKLFNPRQQAVLAVLGRYIRDAYSQLVDRFDADYASVIAGFLSCIYGRQIDYCSAFCRWVSKGEFVAATLGVKRIFR